MIDRYKNNPENSFTTKVGENIPSGFSLSRISSFKSIGNKHAVYRRIDCMKKFYKSFRAHTMEIINFKKTKMKFSTNEQQKSYVIFVKKKLKTNMLKIQNMVKFGIIVIVWGKLPFYHKRLRRRI